MVASDLGTMIHLVVSKTFLIFHFTEYFFKNGKTVYIRRTFLWPIPTNLVFNCLINVHPNNNLQHAYC